MEYLKFFAIPQEKSDFGGDIGDAQVEFLYGDNACIQHGEYNIDGLVVNAYCASLTNDNDALFLYLGSYYSDIINDMSRNLNQFNEESVKNVWPRYYRAYKNGVNREVNKFCLTRMPHYDDSDILYWVVKIEKRGEIDMWDIDSYWNILLKIVQFTHDMLEEINANNGIMPLKETLHIYAKEFRYMNTMKLIGKTLGGLI